MLTLILLLLGFAFTSSASLSYRQWTHSRTGNTPSDPPLRFHFLAFGNQNLWGWTRINRKCGDLKIKAGSRHNSKSLKLTAGASAVVDLYVCVWREATVFTGPHSLHIDDTINTHIYVTFKLCHSTHREIDIYNIMRSSSGGKAVRWRRLKLHLTFKWFSVTSRKTILLSAFV